MNAEHQNTAIVAYEILKRRDFKEGDIAGLAEYLEEYRQRAMQPVLDQIDAKFDRVTAEIAALRSEVVTWKQAWIFMTILIGVAMVLPEALDRIFDLIKSLHGVAEPAASS